MIVKSAAPQWLHDAVAAPDFPAAAAAAAAAVAGGTHGDASAAAAAAGPSPLGDDEKRAFLRAALRSPPLSQARHGHRRASRHASPLTRRVMCAAAATL
jgi:hypothetical protein